MRPWYDRSRAARGAMGHLYIVARSNPQLYEFLAHEFSGTRGLKVVLDRREQRQGGAPDSEERRLQPVDQDLRAWDLALSSVHDR
jgi:hypothetical protein